MSAGAFPGGRRARAILFDLDGTLVDSVPDITAAVNELLAGRGLPPLAIEQVRGMIGGGVRKLVERALATSGVALSQAVLDEADHDMGPIYRRHLTRLTRLMPGAAETLAHFHAAGTRLGVVTNKPQAATRDILLHFRLFERFGAIVGGDAAGGRLKPAPDALLMALDTLGVAADAAVMVGDSATDVAAARAAGMPVILVRGGYTKAPVEELGADLVCSSLSDLPAALSDLSSAA